MLKPCLFALSSLAASIANICHAESTGSRLEEVLVTAQKKSENLLHVPISIDVVGAEFIEKSGALGISDLEMAMPSVNFGRGGRKIRGEIAIRGVGDYARNIGTDARVAVYVDEVPLGRSSAFDTTLMDIQQIEVLKGPQGTLYGNNSIAGAINITSNQPTDTNQHSLHTTAGQRGLGIYSLTSNIAINENLKTRVQVAHKESDGHIKNIYSGDTLQGRDADSIRATLNYQVSDALSLRFSGDWLKDSSSATNAEALDDTLAPKIFQVAHDTNEYEERHIWGSALKASWKLSNTIEVVSISGYRESSFEALSEEDYSPFPVSDSFFDEEYEQITQEIRIHSTQSNRFEYIAGLFAMRGDLSSERGARLLNTVTPPSPVNFEVFTPGILESSNYAAFGSADWFVSENFSITTGLRWKTEKKTLNYYIADTTGFFDNGNLDDDATFDATLGRLSFNVEELAGDLVYASISQGEKSGGWNADFVEDINNIEFEQEFSTNYEIGYKSTFANQKLQIQAAAFNTKFEDFQVFQFDGTQTTIKNAAEATSRGLELDMQAAFITYLKLSLAASYTDTEYDTFKNADSSFSDYSGNKLQYAPELTGYIAIDLTLPGTFIDGSSHAIHLEYGYSDGYFSDPANDKATQSIGSFFILNGHYTLTIADDIEITLWGKNLTDEEILRFKGQSFLGIQRGYYEPPRTIGLSFSSNF